MNKNKIIKDPVCHMKVDNNSKHHIKYKDKSFYFCSSSCQSKFRNEPDKYIKNEKETIVLDKGTQYTCPMHPEIIQDEPGDCPKCGMALEPIQKKTLEKDDNLELETMTKKFWISSILAVPLFLLAMMADLTEILFSILSMKEIQFIEFLLATPIVIWGGWSFYVKAYKSVITKNLNMFTLIGLGVSVAWIYSVIALFFPHIFPQTLQSEHNTVPVYFEAAGVIITLVLLGQVLELKARSKTNMAIKMLLDLVPAKALRINNDKTEEIIDIESIKVNDILKIKPGEKIPVDGVIIDGTSSIDESMITGEPISVEKKIDDGVIGATINENGTLLIKATKIGEDTLISQIIQMVADAQRSKAPIQKLANTVSSYFVPSVVFISIMTYIIWYFWGPEPSMAYAIVNAVAVLIIACPCALGLATPISIMVGTGQGALSGILIKNAQALETMQKINTLVVDKTGTLTQGKPEVTSIITANNYNIKDIISFAASIEQNSEHPLSSAVIRKCKNMNLPIKEIKEFEYLTGKGVTGYVGNSFIALGNLKLMNNLGIQVDDIQLEADELRMEGQTVIYIAINNTIAGLICISDPIKENTKQVIRDLQNLNINVVMLTGDNKITANAVAKKLNIQQVYSDVLPQDKLSVIKQLQSKGNIVAMAGDGINDAPALTAADVGIAMGTGTDIAIESAEVTLIKGDLRGILKAYNLSKETMKNIKQNLIFAFMYNSAGVPIAAGILYPMFGVLLSPVIAAAAMSLSSVSVIFNALRLKKIKL